jgi:hypothetical protein
MKKSLKRKSLIFSIIASFPICQQASDAPVVIAINTFFNPLFLVNLLAWFLDSFAFSPINFAMLQ